VKKIFVHANFVDAKKMRKFETNKTASKKWYEVRTDAEV